MMWGQIIGGVLSGLGSAAGAGLFGGGSNAEGGGAKKAKHHQLDYDRRRIKAIVDGANDAGIHPLAAIGAASGGGGFAAPVNAGGSNWGIGDAIGAGANAFAELYESDQDRLERAEDRAYNESMERRRNAIETLRSKELTPERKLQLENLRLQNELLSTDIATSRTKLASMRNDVLGAAGPASVLSSSAGTLAPPGGRSDVSAEYPKHWGDDAADVEGWANAFDDLRSGRYKGKPFPYLGEAEVLWQNWLKSKGLWGILRGSQGRYVQPPGRGPNPNR